MSRFMFSPGSVVTAAAVDAEKQMPDETRAAAVQTDLPASQGSFSHINVQQMRLKRQQSPPRREDGIQSEYCGMMSVHPPTE